MRSIPSTSELLTTFDAISHLANVYRHNGMAFDAQRKENVAEHSYVLATIGCALAEEINKKLVAPLDLGKIAQFALVHDLVEAFMDSGDISVYAPKNLLKSKKSEEESAFKKVKEQTKSLPWIADTIKKYESHESAEANYVYALDKIIVHIIVLLNDEHHAKPTFEQYLETEAVAIEKITRSFPQLLPYFSELCEMFKNKPHFFSDGIPIDT